MRILEVRGLDCEVQLPSVLIDFIHSGLQHLFYLELSDSTAPLHSQLLFLIIVIVDNAHQPTV